MTRLHVGAILWICCSNGRWVQAQVTEISGAKFYAESKKWVYPRENEDEGVTWAWSKPVRKSNARALFGRSAR